jgi:UDP-N-acetylmuramoyl-tripeptide--D-alanyl-D-alanine ligase
MRLQASQVVEDLHASGGCRAEGPLGATEFLGVSTDSRQETEGSLFVALRGDRFDAHDFVADAVRGGARGVIVERNVPETAEGAEGVCTFQVEDSVRALQALAAASLRRHPVQSVAITGSNGKTTTKDLTAQALATLGPVHATRGNRNNHIGVPLTILERRGDERFLVAEMGANDFGEIGLLSRLLQPCIALITNIGRAHLERFGDVEGVTRAKSEIFEGLLPDGLAVLNADDPRTPELQRRLAEQRIVHFGFSAEADVHIDAARDLPDGGQMLQINGQRLRLPRAGAGNARNAAAALAVAVALGAEMATAAHALESTVFTAQRTVWVTLGDVQVLDDTYNANPDSMREALKLLQARPERRIAVLGEMLELGASVRALHEGIGRKAHEAGVALLLGYGEHMRHTVRAALAAGVPAARHFEDMTQLLQFLQQELQPGDAVLVKGSRGCRMERVVEALRAEVV